ncbi:hypothetical protein ABI59_08995 [Acidobacteria bacterium Mor1]|nr:hypothetical protein ABI59_08995 [Acidobacteria bacterium Mor1]
MSRSPAIPELRADLLAWYRENRRDLPWRRTGDPYAIWVSEIMLQQTQVATVIPYYQAFLERFPDVASLAAAGEEEVLARWSGLGYYRRARMLHAGAKAVMERHGGRVPRDPAEILALPGVGRYTAGAIASIAFDLCEPILDGNVRRVLSRWYALDDPPGSGLDRTLWERAALLAQGPDPGDLNQALMELGATVCSPKDPRCLTCPVRRHCEACRQGRPEAFPRPVPRARTRTVQVAAAWIERGDKVLLERPAGLSPFRGNWDLPAREIPATGGKGRSTGAAGAGEAGAAGVLARELERDHGLEVAPEAQAGRARHGILDRRLDIAILPCRLLKGRVSGRKNLRWAPLAELEEQAVSGVTHKIRRALAGRPGKQPV